MTERKPAHVDSKALAAGENAIGKITAHLTNPEVIETAKGLASAGAKGIEAMARAAPRSVTGRLMNFMNTFSRGVTNAMPTLSALGSIATPMISAIAQTAPKVIPILLESDSEPTRIEECTDEELEKRRRAEHDAMLRLAGAKGGDNNVPQTFFQLQQNHAGKRN